MPPHSARGTASAPGTMRGGGSYPPQQPRNRATPPEGAEGDDGQGCTVDQYAEAKGIPADFIRSLGITDYKDNRWPNRVLRIPYFDSGGNEASVRIRHRLLKGPSGIDRFVWRKGSTATLYGMPFLSRAREIGHAALVEGESDCHTLWHHQIPAIGIPGATGWKESRDAELMAGIERIYVIIEPDKGGAAVLGWISRSAIKDRAWLVDLGEHKDASGLYLNDRPGSRNDGRRRSRTRSRGGPGQQRSKMPSGATRWRNARSFARQPRILDEFVKDAAAAGVTGEQRNAQLTYLAVTSRLLPRISSLAVKGQSSSGKSWVVERALEFFPRSAYYAMTAASEHALIYDKEPLEHRMLVIYEASGLEGDTFSYVVRSLLSEGKLRYPTVIKQGGELVTVMIERDGPTGLITTTTALKLHAENETRLLSISSDDSKEQTSAVLLEMAEEDRDDIDFGRWHALQRWLELGHRKVTIPYGKPLATLIPPAAPRLRRDFGQVLALIRSHALLHQATRDRDGNGRVVATLDDYDVVRHLVVDVISEAVEKTVKPEVRQIVAAVAAHGRSGRDPGQARRRAGARQVVRQSPGALGAQRRVSRQSGGAARTAAQAGGRKLVA